jgi:hypothetical protein
MPVDRSASRDGDLCGDALHQADTLPSDCLPPDLIELAGQLHCDAMFLASRYPAPSFAFGMGATSSDAPDEGVVPRRFSYRVPLAAAALLAAIGTGLWATNFASNKPNVDRSERPVAAGAAAVTPMVSFELFNGAEQEAVLDLLEEEGVRQGSVSI